MRENGLYVTYHDRMKYMDIYMLKSNILCPSFCNNSKISHHTWRKWKLWTFNYSRRL